MYPDLNSDKDIERSDLPAFGSGILDLLLSQ